MKFQQAILMWEHMFLYKVCTFSLFLHYLHLTYLLCALGNQQVPIVGGVGDWWFLKIATAMTWCQMHWPTELTVRVKCQVMWGASVATNSTTKNTSLTCRACCEFGIESCFSWRGRPPTNPHTWTPEPATMLTTLMLHWQEISYFLQGIKISLSTHPASIQWVQGTLYPGVAIGWPLRTT